MRSRTLFLSVLSITLLAGAAESLAAQADLASRGPRFLWAPADGRASADASNAELLHRRVSITLYSGTLDEALKEIARQAHLELIYSEALVPAERRVTLDAQDITIAAALTEVLLGSGVDVVLLPTGQMGLVRKQAMVAEPGVIVGRVTNAETGEPVVNAQVVVEGTGRGTSADADGRFRIADVPAGRHTVAVTSIGYARSTQEVEVGDGETVTVDFALEVSPTTLSELVVTATGQQRRVELGHVVGRIKADSVVKEAPVSNLSELLTGRVPGLQVFTRSGQVGGQVSLQVRTPNSITLATEPIVVVDGVRYTSSASGSPGLLDVELTSRLNDLNPNDIELIEVVKGPSAATLFGTDASNGVLIITTKRGHAGPTRWNAYARFGLSDIPIERYPASWWGWGSTTTSCALGDVAQGTCAQDSVTALSNPLRDPQLTIMGSKPRWEYGANVAGGRQELRYYFSADVERAIGPFQMPPASVRQLDEERGITELAEEHLEPNAFAKMSLRGNVSAALSPTTELRFSTGYGYNDTRTLSGVVGTPYEKAMLSTPADPYGASRDAPQELFALSSTERVDRFFGIATAQWRPGSWIEARSTLGIDLATTNRQSLVRPGDAVEYFGSGGFAGDERTRQLATTADVGLIALVRDGRLSFRTAVGAQYVRSVANTLASTGFELPPGGESVAQATFQGSSQSYSETVTLGSYLEETVGLNDRLFLTGALRIDGASAFGRDYDAAIYPKASVSWLLSEEPFLPRLPGLDELRLRYAYGASGQQALPTMALPTFTVGQTTVDGTATNRITLSSVGNPNLRPERVREHEFGFDASALQGRFRLGLTWFDRTTIDQIVTRSLPPGFGFIYANLGRVTGRGFEAEFTVRPVETGLLSWQVSFQHAVRRSILVDLGDVNPSRQIYGAYVEGYPLGARFGQTVVGYGDTNGDGIIGQDEVELSQESVYLGESTPPRTQTLTTALGLFQQRLRLSALVERRSGFAQVDELKWFQCLNGRCRGAVDPNAPLAEQAKAVAAAAFLVRPVERGDFTRLREVTASLDLPSALLGTVGIRTASLSLSARNLALWTSFSGPDPESAAVTGVSGISGGVADEIPQSRSWVLRLDLGF